MTSDRLPISGIVASLKQKSIRTKGYIRLLIDKFPKLAHVVSQWILYCFSLEFMKDVENFAEDICRVSKDAINAVGKRPNRGNEKSAPW